MFVADAETTAFVTGDVDDENNNGAALDDAWILRPPACAGPFDVKPSLPQGPVGFGSPALVPGGSETDAGALMMTASQRHREQLLELEPGCSGHRYGGTRKIWWLYRRRPEHADPLQRSSHPLPLTTCAHNVSVPWHGRGQEFNPPNAPLGSHLRRQAHVCP